MKPDELKVLVVGLGVWGKGDTLDEALKKMRSLGGRTPRYIVYVAHPDTHVDRDGFLSYPADYPAKEIHRVGFKAKARK